MLETINNKNDAVYAEKESHLSHFATSKTFSSTHNSGQLASSTPLLFSKLASFQLDLVGYSSLPFALLVFLLHLSGLRFCLLQMHWALKSALGHCLYEENGQAQGHWFLLFGRHPKLQTNTCRKLCLDST